LPVNGSGEKVVGMSTNAAGLYVSLAVRAVDSG